MVFKLVFRELEFHMTYSKNGRNVEDLIYML